MQMGAHMREVTHLSNQSCQIRLSHGVSKLCSSYAAELCIDIQILLLQQHGRTLQEIIPHG